MEANEITRANVYDMVEKLIKDPCTSNWLKESIRVSMSRDPLDALYDAELLAEIIKCKWENTIGKEPNAY